MITIYIPEQEQGLIEEIVRTLGDKSFPRIVMEALKENYTTKKVDSLFGGLGKQYRGVSGKEAVHETVEKVSEDASKQGRSD